MGLLIKAATTCPSPFSCSYIRPQETLGGNAVRPYYFNTKALCRILKPESDGSVDLKTLTSPRQIFRNPACNAYSKQYAQNFEQ